MTAMKKVDRRIMAGKITIGHQMKRLSLAIGREDWGMARAYAIAIASECIGISDDIYSLVVTAPKKGGKA